MNNEAIKVLKELAENNSKRSKIGIVRELMPAIEDTMKQGVTLAAIHAALTEKAGIDMKFLTFISAYKRIKKESSQNKQSGVTPITPEEASKAQSKPQASFEIPSFKHNPVPNPDELY